GEGFEDASRQSFLFGGENGHETCADEFGDVVALTEEVDLVEQAEFAGQVLDFVHGFAGAGECDVYVRVGQLRQCTHQIGVPFPGDKLADHQKKPVVDAELEFAADGFDTFGGHAAGAELASIDADAGHVVDAVFGDDAPVEGGVVIFLVHDDQVIGPGAG